MNLSDISFSKMDLTRKVAVASLSLAAASVFLPLDQLIKAQAAQIPAFTAQGDILEGSNVLPLVSAITQQFEFGVFENGAGYQSQSGDVVYLEYNGDFGCSIMPDGRATLFETEFDISAQFIAPHVSLLAFNETAIDVADVPQEIARDIMGHCAYTIDNMEEGTTSFYYTDAFSAEKIGDFVSHPQGYGIPFTPN